MRQYFLLIIAILFNTVHAQLNCEAFRYNGDTLQYEACKLVENIDDRYYQFSAKFQQTYDNALEICPHFAYGYREKSVAYLKSGDFISWKKLMDKAVEYDAKGNLGYRGWCRYQFFKDYKGAIADFEALEKLIPNIGYAANGDYHLQIAKAICYSALGKKQKAIDIINKQLTTTDYIIGWYDYYQLGVTYLEIGDTNKAKESFEKQAQKYQFAENMYYMAKIMKNEGLLLEYATAKEKAIELYAHGKNLNDPYTHHFNKVYQKTIESE